jgi:hypothetical protein
VWIYITEDGERLELGTKWDAPMQRDRSCSVGGTTLKVDEVEEL